MKPATWIPTFVGMTELFNDINRCILQFLVFWTTVDGNSNDAGSSNGDGSGTDDVNSEAETEATSTRNATEREPDTDETHTCVDPSTLDLEIAIETVPERPTDYNVQILDDNLEKDGITLPSDAINSDEAILAAAYYLVEEGHDLSSWELRHGSSGRGFDVVMIRAQFDAENNQWRVFFQEKEDPNSQASIGIHSNGCLDSIRYSTQEP